MATEVYKKYIKWKTELLKLTKNNIKICRNELERLLDLKTKKTRDNFMNKVKFAYNKLSTTEQNKLWNEYDKRFQELMKKQITQELLNIEQMIKEEQEFIDSFDIQIILKDLPDNMTLNKFIRLLFDGRRPLIINYPDRFTINGRTITDIYE